ncbi:MFS transporter [Bacillus sp. EAC]|uniref:MFS transporter n=1 Tax=Bacillus sp. EAC TaxID=1978338 RepID=UPI000B445811|nr:MFS transporter [Bacillus sp. EAC]
MHKGIYILAIATFVAGTVEFIITGLLSMIAGDLHVSVGAVGQLVSIFSVVFAFGAPVFIAITSKMERKKLLLVALTIFFFGNLLSIISPNFIVLLIARIILAASCSIVIVVSITTAANIVSSEIRGRAIGVIFMGISSSLVFGVPLGTIVGEKFGWRMTFALVGLLSLISMIGIYKFLPKVMPQPTIPLIKQIATLKNKNILSIQLISFLQLTGHFTIYTYFTPYLHSTMGLSTKMISIVLLVFGVAGIFGGWFGGWSTDKFGGNKTIVFNLGLLAFSILLLTFAPKSMISLFIIVILWGGLSWSISPAVQDSLAKVSKESADIQVGLNNSFSHTGIALGSSLGGILISQYSVSMNALVGAIIVILALFSAMYSFVLNNKVSVKTN